MQTRLSAQLTQQPTPPPAQPIAAVRVDAAQQHQPSSARRASPAPRPQPGPGLGFYRPAWAVSGLSDLTRRIWSNSGVWVSVDQKGDRLLLSWTLIHFSPFPFPSLSGEVSSMVTHSGRRKNGGGAAAELLTGACARPRLSAPPSRGLAMVPMTPSHRRSPTRWRWFFPHDDTVVVLTAVIGEPRLTVASRVRVTVRAYPIHCLDSFPSGFLLNFKQIDSFSF